MNRRGVSLVELLVVGLITSMLLGALLQMFISMHNANKATNKLPEAHQATVDAVNRIAADVRRAPLCASGCVTGTVDSAFTEAEPDRLSVYRTSTGQVLTYQVSSGNLQRIADTTSTVFIDGTVTLGLQYLVNASLTYGTALDPDSPTAPWVDTVATADLKSIMAVKVNSTVERDGYKGAYSTVVRLRNSPKKLLSTE